MRHWRENMTMVLFAYIGLGFPDIDQLFLPILHHRSIITHSIAIPVAFLLWRNKAVSFAVFGFILGVSIHISADVLSNPVGFGMVWLPWPIKIPLGPLSPLWLAANAVVGLVWAKTSLLQLGGRKSIILYATLATVLAFTYALFHENGLVPLLSFAIIFAISSFATKWVIRQAWYGRLPDAKSTQA